MRTFIAGVALLILPLTAKPQSSDAVVTEVARISQALAQQAPQQASAAPGLDDILRISKKIFTFTGNDGFADKVTNAQNAEQAAIRLKNSITTFRDLMQQNVMACDYKNVLKLGDDVFNSVNDVTSYLEKKKPSGDDRKDTPMTNYVTEWLNRKSTHNHEQQAQLKLQSLLGVMEQGCQTALHLTDIHSQLGVLLGTSNLFNITLQPTFDILNKAGKPVPYIAGTDGGRDKGVTPEWSSEWNLETGGGATQRVMGADSMVRATDLLVAETAAASRDALIILASLSKDLENSFRDNIVFAEQGPGGGLTCPEGYDPIVRPPVGKPYYETWTPPAIWEDYVNGNKVTRTICGFSHGARAAQNEASVKISQLNIAAVQAKLLAVQMKIDNQRLALDNTASKAGNALQKHTYNGL